MTKKIYGKLILESFRCLVIINEFDILSSIMNEAVNEIFNFSVYCANLQNRNLKY